MISFRVRLWVVVFGLLLSACGGNAYVIDEPPQASTERAASGLTGVPSTYREELARMLDANIRNPGDAGLLYEIGLLYQYSGRPDQAERFYGAALQAEPRHVPAAVNLAAILKLRKETERAISVLNDLFTAGADDPRARTDLALLYREMGDLEQSLEQSRYVLKNFGQLYGARLNIGTIYMQQKKYELALTIYNDLVKEFPEDARAHFSLGFIYQELGAFDKARAGYSSAVSFDTKSFEAYNNLGLLHMFRKEVTDAERNFRASINANVNFAPAYLNLGIALRNRNDYPGAEKAYKRALSIQKTLVEAQYNLALLYDDYWDRPKEALNAWTDYLDTFGDSIENARRNFAEVRIEKLEEQLDRQRADEAARKEESQASPAAEEPSELDSPASEQPVEESGASDYDSGEAALENTDSAAVDDILEEEEGLPPEENAGDEAPAQEEPIDEPVKNAADDYPAEVTE